MNKIFTTLFALSLLSTICFAQDFIEDENWLKGFQTEADYFPTLTYYQPTRRFTDEDVKKGKQRLNLIRRFAPKNEWEGVYFGQAPIGDEKFIWNSEGGFFRFHFYHELKGFDFGTVVDNSGFIEVNYEKLSIDEINKRQLTKIKLVKVKLGERRFLVPENRLPEFCELAAGLDAKSNDLNYLWDYFWAKDEDKEKQIFGLPVVAPEYKSFLRSPIEAKIIGVGKRKVIPNKQSTKEYNFDYIHYPVTINAGKNKKLKIGMNFFVEDLGEWIEITEVSQSKSEGIIRRDFDENMKEECRDSEGGSGQITSCKEIKIGMKARTKSSL